MSNQPESSTTEKMTTLTNGIRPFRFPFGLAAAYIALILVSGTDNVPRALFLLLLFGLITFLLYISRRVRFDHKSVYRINGNRIRETPYNRIVSIKRSPLKLNSKRYWKITFLDHDDQEKKFLFLEGNFQHGSTKEMIKNATAVNPEIVVWTHPHFNHPPEKEKS